MSDLMLKIDLDDLFELIKQLSPEQRRLVRQRLDLDWSTRFAQALDAIQADIPPAITDDEAAAAIEQAVREVRTGKQ
ncbi:MAG: hypothetical protein JXJ20_14725 [Anaerolineae bacterium]|nr:hypothetical protein [Anaerolineae bacterium]